MNPKCCGVESEIYRMNPNGTVDEYYCPICKTCYFVANVYRDVPTMIDNKGDEKMMWYSFEGVFNLPDDATKKQMLDMWKEFEEYIEDDEIDYLSPLTGTFDLCIGFDEEGKELFEFLGKVKKYGMTLTYLKAEGNEPEYASKMRANLAELQGAYDNGIEDVVAVMKEILAYQFPKQEWENDDGIFFSKGE